MPLRTLPFPALCPLAQATLASLLAGRAEAEATRCAALLQAIPTVKAGAEEAARSKRAEEEAAVVMGAPPMAAASAAAAAQEAEGAVAAASEAGFLLKRCRAEAKQEAEEARSEGLADPAKAAGADRAAAGPGALLTAHGWQSEAVRSAGLALPPGVRMVLSDGSRWVVSLLQLPPRPPEAPSSRPSTADADPARLPATAPATHVFACSVGEGPARGVMHAMEELCFRRGPELWRARVVEAPLGFELCRYDALAPAEGEAAPFRSSTLDYTDWNDAPGEWELPSHVQWCPSVPPVRGAHVPDLTGHPTATLPLLAPRPLQEVAAAAERKKLGGAEPAHSSWGLRDATTLSSTDHFSKGLLLAGSGRLRDLLETTTSS